MQARVLEALYAQAVELFDRGRQDAELRNRLRMRGYGDWTLENVYAFVYESAVDLPGQGHQAFVGGIREQDFAGLLGDAAAEN